MSPEKEKILLDIFNNDSLKSYAYRVSNGNSLKDDLFSELILSINDMDEIKLFNLVDDKKILNYCYKIIWLSWNSTTSPFYIKYLKENKTDFIISETKKKYCEAFVFDELKKMESNLSRFPTEIKIFELYLKLKSSRKVAKETGIPRSTVQYLVSQVKKELLKIK
jgi:hypothetical protein